MRRRKYLSMALAMSLVLGSFSGAFATAGEKVEKSNYNEVEKRVIENYEQGQQKTYQRLSDDERNVNVKDEDKVRVIVELKERPVIEYATERGLSVAEMDQDFVESKRTELIEKQEGVKKQMAESGIAAEYHNSFVNIANGFAITTTYAEAKELEKYADVKKVSISAYYQRPEPEMETSKEYVRAVQTWNDLNFKGEGMVVSIIDTGLDPNHEDMRVSDPSKVAFTKEQAEARIVEANKTLKKKMMGKYYTSKIPYGYNYADNNDEIRDIQDYASPHGIHVGGTVAANGDEKKGGVVGIAPEAQLLAMKVFSNGDGRGTYGDLMVTAMDHSVAFGADAMNLSIGATSMFVRSGDPQQEAVTRATQNGIVMAISAGNSNRFGNGVDDAFAANPDVGVVGRPGLTPESIQVAASNNEEKFLYKHSISFEGQPMEIIGYGADDWPGKQLGGEIELMPIGGDKLGTPDNYKGIDVTGKVVLVSRGAHAFADKAKWAAQQGAKGILVYNNVDKSERDIYFNQGGFDIPIMLMYKPEGMALEKYLGGKTKKITVKQTDKNMGVLSGRLTDFSSWGVTPSLTFKPDIMAPGGHIRSTFNQGEYGIMSGTSMASPHVAGGAALVLERVKKDTELNKIQGSDRATLVKNLLMSTSKPVYFPNPESKDAKAFTSVRAQGAGMMDVAGACSTNVYVVDSTASHTETKGLSKVNLEEVGNTFDFELTLKNFGKETVQYAVYNEMIVELPVLEDGIYKNPYQVSQNVDGYTMTIDGKKSTVTDAVYVEVGAGQDKKVSVSVDISDALVQTYTREVEAGVTNYTKEAKKKMSEIFKNGNFVEGFIRFEERKVGDKVITRDAINEKYYGNTNATDLAIGYLGFRGMWKQAPVIDNSVYGMDGEDKSFYGYTMLMDENTSFNIGKTAANTYDAKAIAFSPNGDGKKDAIQPLLSFLRNSNKLDLNILDKDKKHLRTLDMAGERRKNYYDGGQGNGKYQYDSKWLWDGTVSNRKVEDGKYFYEVATEVDYKGETTQSKLFPVVVDTVEPKIEKVSYDDKTKMLTVDVKEDGSGVRNISVMKVSATDSEEIMNVVEGGKLVADRLNGKFDLTKVLPNGQHKIAVVVEDNAGNVTAKATELIVNKSGKIFSFDEEYKGKSPDGNMFTSNKIPVQGKIIDAGALKDNKLTVNLMKLTNIKEGTLSSAYETKLVRTVKIDATPQADGSILYSGEVEADGTGMYFVEMVAEDTYGTILKGKADAIVDLKAPVITMTEEPKDRIVSETTTSVSIAGKVEENLNGLAVYVNGENVFKKELPSSYAYQTVQPVEYTIAKTNVDLVPGENIVTVKAVDEAGNVTENKYEVYRKKDANDPGPQPKALDVTVTGVEAGKKVEVAYHTPVTVKAEATKTSNWEVKISQGEKVVYTKTFTGKDDIEFSWAPEKGQAIDGDFDVYIKATAGEETKEFNPAGAEIDVHNYTAKVIEGPTVKMNYNSLVVETKTKNASKEVTNITNIVMIKDASGKIVGLGAAGLKDVQAGQEVEIEVTATVSAEGTYTAEVLIWSAKDGVTIGEKKTVEFKLDSAGKLVK